MSGRVMLVLSYFHGLDYVRVGADDVVYSLVNQPVCQFLLGRMGQALVFQTPMHARYDSVGLHLAGYQYIGFDLYRIDVIHDVGGGRFNAVGVVSISQ